MDHQEKKKKKEKEKKKKKKIDKRKIVTLRRFSTPADNNYEVALRNVWGIIIIIIIIIDNPLRGKLRKWEGGPSFFFNLLLLTLFAPVFWEWIMNKEWIIIILPFLLLMCRNNLNILNNVYMKQGKTSNCKHMQNHLGSYAHWQIIIITSNMK